MGKFLDALQNKSSTKAATVDPASLGQPVPVALIIEPPSDLTSGSSLNKAAFSAWPSIIDAGSKFWNGGWRKSFLKEVTTDNIKGNYGSVTSRANFGFRFRAFDGIGNLSNESIQVPHRPTYDDLVPIVWATRIPNPNTKTNTTAQKGPITIQTDPSTWLGSNTASLTRSGVTLL